MNSLMIGTRVFCIIGYRENETDRWIYLRACATILDSSPEKMQYLIQMDKKYWDIIKTKADPSTIELSGRIRNIGWDSITDLVDEIDLKEGFDIISKPWDLT